MPQCLLMQKVVFLQSSRSFNVLDAFGSGVRTGVTSTDAVGCPVAIDAAGESSAGFSSGAIVVEVCREVDAGATGSATDPFGMAVATALGSTGAAFICLFP